MPPLCFSGMESTRSIKMQLWMLSSLNMIMIGLTSTTIRVPIEFCNNSWYVLHSNFSAWSNANAICSGWSKKNASPTLKTCFCRLYVWVFLVSPLYSVQLPLQRGVLIPTLWNKHWSMFLVGASRSISVAEPLNESSAAVEGGAR